MGAKKTENAAVGPKQEAFIDRLLEGMSVHEAAAALRTHRTTCWRWLQVTEVQTELTRRREERRTAVAEELGGAALEAVRLLRSMLSDTALTPQVRLRTACALLDRSGHAKTNSQSFQGLEGWPRHEKEAAFDRLLSFP